MYSYTMVKCLTPLLVPSWVEKLLPYISILLQLIIQALLEVNSAENNLDVNRSAPRKLCVDAGGKFKQ